MTSPSASMVRVTRPYGTVNEVYRASQQFERDEAPGTTSDVPRRHILTERQRRTLLALPTDDPSLLQAELLALPRPPLPLSALLQT